MTKFNHSKRNGKRKRPKQRGPRRSLQLWTTEQLVEHRRLAFLRNPSPERARKLAQVQSKGEDDV